jgi:nitrate reductase gamma subunit
VKFMAEKAGTDGKRRKQLMRPALPTTVKEVWTYWGILGASGSMKMSILVGGALGIASGAGLSILLTRGIFSSVKRFASRLFLIPTLGFSCAALGITGGAATSAYSIRDKVADVSVPVGSTTDWLIRTLLPKMVVELVEVDVG